MINRFKPGKKKCKAEGCSNSFDKDINQPFKTWCSPDCLVKIWNKKKPIVEKKKQAEEKRKRTEEKKQWSKEKQEIKESIKTRSEWLSDLEKLVNEISRLIDFEQPCISCGNFGKPQAGHFHSVASDGSIRFNLHNIHIQDYHCNVHKSSNQQGYKEGLVKIYYAEYLDYVEYGLKNIYFEPVKLQVFEIKEKIAICRDIVKALKQNLSIRTPEERLYLRDEINTTIGIYTKPFIAKC